MPTANRKTLRTDLKTELAPAFSSMLVDADDFYKYEPASYHGHSPVVFLASSGAEHPEVTKALNSVFFVDVHLLALYKDSAGVYTEEQAADLLDDLEQTLSSAVEAKRVVANKWQKLSIEARSFAEPTPVGGELYLHEVVTLRASLY